jgi:exocyst complex component 4
VRLHCFFYLAPLRHGPAGALFYGGQDSTDPSQEVVRLNADLLAIEEILSTTIDEKKVIYIFEGVSHLVSVVLMDAVTNIRKINKNGVKKMCRNIFSVQHTLTSNITGSRESSLDSAKQFYELLNLRPQVRPLLPLVTDQ